MKILLIAIGSRGDVQPFVVLGKALKSRGHDVTIAVPIGFSQMVAAAGLQHREVPVNIEQMLNEPEIREAIAGFTGKLKAYRWAESIMNDQLDAVWKTGLELSPDVILYHFKAGVAAHLGRKLNIHSVPVVLQPGFAATGDYPQFMVSSRNLGSLLNRISHKFILSLMRFGTGMMVRRWQKKTETQIGPAMNPLEGFSPTGSPIRIHAYSPSIVPRPDEWPATEVQTGYLFDEVQPFEPPAKLAAFLADGPPPLYIGFGSMPGMDEDKLAKVVGETLTQTGHRAVVATGWGAMRKLEASDNIHIIEGAPHTWLFPRVSAVIHHGGSGTTHEGLRWGRPSIVCPLFADQPFFGQRVADLGAGPQPIRQKKLTAQKLSAAIDFALSATVAANAKSLSDSISAEDGVGQVCKIVDQLASA